jgi:uncharacterized protein YcbK (DUF882 family)
MKISEHFDDSEFTCHCGCGQNVIHQELVDMLEAFRARVDKPIIVHCVNRCSQHNAVVGGVKNSLHREGMACDCHVKKMPIKELHAIALSSEDILTGGIGIYDWGIHVDVGAKKTWSEV